MLFSPSAPSPTPIVHHAATAAPGAPIKRPVPPVQRIPLDGSKPLIPPASAKLGPPPDPRPALPLDIGLQQLSPAAETAGRQSPAAEQSSATSTTSPGG
ncbi:MAG TPA: hypothetical protein VM782_09940 [Stellaceae bacterium]|nr:hypothetical protein [Stellaceae bacterium]